MSVIKKIEEDISKMIREVGYEIDNFKLAVSNRPDLGEYQINDCMSLAKKYHKKPIEIANEIKEKLEEDERFTNMNIAGPGFINISLSDKVLMGSMNAIYGDINHNIDSVNPKKIMLDYGGANVAKSLHVGHLRSANIGEALKRLLKVLGCEAISDAHLGDYGRPLGLVILEIQKRYPDLAYFDSSYEGDYNNIDLPITNDDIENIYPIASQKAKEDETYLEEAREITTKIQNKEKGYYDLWKRIVEISKKEIKKVYDKLNVFYDLWEGESDSIDYLDELLTLCEENHLIELSEGAKIINVKEEDDTAPIPPLLLVKSNGSLSYETTDLTTILERSKKFNPDEIWYLADSRQQLHFEQVFRASRKAKLVREDVKLEYISFGTMNGKNGKPFKTRDGGVLSLNKLIEMVMREVETRLNYDIVAKEKVEETIEKIAISSLKYADFLPFRSTDYIFDISKFADTEGKTGAYLLYSTIRMKSLLTKAGNSTKEYQQVSTDRDIILTLLQLPSILIKSYEMKSLNEIADYLYTLTNKYNKFYSENRILTEENENLKSSWILLTDVVYHTNLLLFDILGLQVPEKM